MFLPIWLVIVGALLILGLALWSFLMATGRNPLPRPQPAAKR
jgi:hypothetical protein